jgi:chromosomal replication initiation ATPase DnaA
LDVGVTQHAYLLTSSIDQRLAAAAPSKHANTMPPRKDVPNIYIIGPQSLGKTTLVKHWLIDTSIDKPRIVSEVARTVLNKHSFLVGDIWSSQSQCLEL